MLRADDHVVEFIDDYLHGLLSPDDERIVQHHCAQCRICQTALEEGQRRFDAMGSLPPAEASEKLIQQTINKLEVTTQKQSERWRKAINIVSLATAASILLIGSFHAYFFLLQPDSLDLRMLGQSTVMPGTVTGLRIGLFDRSSGNLVEDVPIQVSLHDRSQGRTVNLASYTSNSSATGPPIELPDWEDGQYELQVVAKRAGRDEQLTTQLTLRRSAKLLLTVDKPMYQPGQTIHMRSLALKQPNLKPLVGPPIEFSVVDPKGNTIFKKSRNASQFGIASADCELATQILEGNYTIQCRSGSVTSKRSVEVRKYVLPKFRVTLNLDQPYYEPGQMAEGTVDCQYFFGKPVAGADVVVQAYSQGTGTQLLAELQLKTNDEGTVDFQVRLPDYLAGREQTGGHASLDLIATVTDTAGQQHMVKASRIVARQPLSIEVIPENDQLVPNVANRIYLYVTYPDGRPAQTDVEVVGSQLRRALTTDEFGVAVFEYTPAASRTSLHVQARDAQGKAAERHVQLTSDRANRDFLIRPNQAVYEGGDTLLLDVLGSGSQPVFVDFVKDGQTIQNETIDVINGRGRLEVDLPAETAGLLQLVAYRFDNSGLAVRKSRLVFVKPAQELRIATTMDQQSYRPGDTATIRFTVTDEESQPSPGALSLAVVDEAVFAVNNLRAGLQQQFFLLNQELLKPVYTIYNWSPDLERSDREQGWEQLQQAVFATTSRTVTRDRDASFPISLSLSSFPDKVARTKTIRMHGLTAVFLAWFLLAGSLAVLGLVVFAIRRPWVFLIFACFSCFMGGLLMVIVAAYTSLGARMAATDEMVAMSAAMDAAESAQREFARNKGPVAVPRVRNYFPETLLWQPQLITDDNGVATLEVPLADSITTWRMTASAVSSQGRMGGGEFPIRVFQPFFVDLNLPVSLTRNDEVSVPCVVYNYLERASNVELQLKPEDWFEPLERDTLTKMVQLAPGEVQVVYYPIRVCNAGNHQLEVIATSGDIADAIRRSIEVVPDGRRVEHTVSVMLDEPLSFNFDIPEEVIAGSTRATLKLMPSTFSQLVDGLDNVFRMPHGCFEQTSSTTYPNVLALSYLKQTGQSVPATEAQARQYIHLGYQRLCSFEVDGGGFDWYGRPPANPVLTAYGLMEFEDMARVHDVDRRMLKRTRSWLLRKRNADGSWSADNRTARRFRTGNAAADQDLVTTAYIAWAAFGGGQLAEEARLTRNFLAGHDPGLYGDDPYLVAMVINSLAEMMPQDPKLERWVEQLRLTKREDPERKLVWWQRGSGDRTVFHGAGRSGDIETTALAVLGLLKANAYPALADGALRWLVQQKDPHGTWHSTQATILALKALLAGTNKPLSTDTPTSVEVSTNGSIIRELRVDSDQMDVVQQLDLTNAVGIGLQSLLVRDLNQSGATVQFTVRYHIEGEEAKSDTAPPLDISLTYDSTRISVNDYVSAQATVTNNTAETIPMVMVDLPIPGGFAIERDELEELKGSGQIAKYEITARQAIIYLRELSPRAKLRLGYRLKATMPVTVTAAPATVYEYYNPQQRDRTQTVQITAEGT
jgi:uncharacterized protein YfaS (alpha-2-macroglobulin family)